MATSPSDQAILNPVLTAGAQEASEAMSLWLAVCWEYALSLMRAMHCLRIHHGMLPPWLDSRSVALFVEDVLKKSPARFATMLGEDQNQVS